ncbi:hypothetical protein [Kitasatospora azatica]|uniref:hypothetical protein n=1 Tax=Kitasatospora azatica TaxID=58347 RepID=UPI0005640CFA|nr:hypothetical protein [Kitasatospora azatica]
MTVLTQTPADRAIRDCVAPLLPARTSMVRLRLLGTDVLLFHRLVRDEHQRREAAAAEPVNSMGALQVLHALPAGLPVPLETLTRPEQAEVRRLPSGAARVTARTVTRSAVRPLAVDLAVARATRTRHPLEAAGQFAPFCRRAILLKQPPVRHDDLVLEAALYGIGVLAQDRGGIRLLLAPAEHRPQRHTAAAWHFVEDLYERLSPRTEPDATVS